MHADLKTLVRYNDERRQHLAQLQALIDKCDVEIENVRATVRFDRVVHKFAATHRFEVVR